MTRVELSNKTWSLSLIPEWGGRVALMQADGVDIMTPLVADSFDPLAWPRGGIYPLMPYSNRVREANLMHEGKSYTLPPHPAALPHTLHGVAQTLQWTVAAQSADSVILVCLYEGEHWPWPVRFEQRFALDGNTLSVRLAVTNLGESSMPAGLGLHPYFHRHPGMRVELNVGRSWQIDDEYLPTGTSEAVSAPVIIDDALQQELALYGSQWDGELKVAYRQGHLLMKADEPITHFVAFAPLDAPYLCLEPVSHLADAFNSPTHEWANRGTNVVQPGQTLEANLRFTWSPR